MIGILYDFLIPYVSKSYVGQRARSWLLAPLLVKTNTALEKSALLTKNYPDQSQQSFGYYLTEMRIHSGINPPL